jgi:hypothetical protein
MSRENSNLKKALTLLLTALSNTSPSSDNKKEWEDIRAQTTRLQDKVKSNQIDPALDQLLVVFAMVRPNSSNSEEWALIREEANRIIKSGDSPDKMLLNLAKQLSKTEPSGSNKKEWKIIRDTASSVITLLN